MIRDKSELKAILQIIRGESPGMSPEQFKESIAAIGLTQHGAAEFFGYSKRVGQRWALAEQAIPLPVQWCLEFMVSQGLKPNGL